LFKGKIYIILFRIKNYKPILDMKVDLSYVEEEVRDNYQKFSKKYARLLFSKQTK